MSIEIGGYDFEGPFINDDSLLPESGVYMVLGRNPPSDEYEAIDVGQSNNVRRRVKKHERADCWYRHNHKEVTVAVRYADKTNRLAIEDELRDLYKDMPCGER